MTLHGTPPRARRRRPVRGAGLVRTWLVDLDRTPREVAVLRRLLAADELDRARRYRFERDRRRFIVGRAELRRILGRALDTDPAALRFHYGPAGKPALDGDGPMRFNVSHADDLAVVAVADGREVGVDVERVRAVPDIEGMAAVVFSPRERAVLDALSDASRLRAFYECWTRKEAFVKAVGGGLGMPVERIEVSFGPGAPVRLVRMAGDERAAARWTLVAIEPGPGYVGALAIEGRRPRIALRRWTD